jgi:Lar family restriction alleviation protein
MNKDGASTGGELMTKSHMFMELEPCNHCGSEAEFVITFQEEAGMVRVECTGCGIRTKDCETDQEAANDWNRRPHEDE